MENVQTNFARVIDRLYEINGLTILLGHMNI